MTKKERLRAIMGNLKNYDFEVNPTYKIDEQDAFVLREMYGEYLRLKMLEERRKAQMHKYYMKNREKNIEKARERYHANRKELARQAKERHREKRGLNNDC